MTVEPTDLDLELALARARAAIPTPCTASTLGGDFWTARPALEQIRQAAHARQRSAAALLHVVLARVAAAIPHTLELPPIVGAPAPLCYFAAILAPPGVGKSSANGIGAELFPFASGFLDPRDNPVADQLPIGSGEGLAEVLFDVVTQPNADTGKPEKVKRQVRHNAYVFVDEGQVLTDIGKRSGSTLLPTVRSIWSGGVIGQSNATTERRRVVPAGQYTFGVVIALQDAHAGAVLDDADAGTPQRFAWARATDPTIPDDTPTWPGPINWEAPGPHELDAIAVNNAQGYRRHRLDVAPDIADELRATDLGRARGSARSDPLDAHAGLLRLKIAGLLSILDHRLTVTLDDWGLAGQIQAASNSVRSEVVALTRQVANERETQTRTRLAGRAVATDEALERRRIVDSARTIAHRVHRDGGCTVAETRRALTGSKRSVFDDALAHALAESWIIEVDEPGQGADKRTLTPGSKRP